MRHKERRDHPKTMYRYRRRLLIHHTQSGRCFYCLKPVTVSDMTVDHILPVCCGGSDDMGNLAGACWDCNQWKGDGLVAEEWVEERKKLFGRV